MVVPAAQEYKQGVATSRSGSVWSGRTVAKWDCAVGSDSRSGGIVSAPGRRLMVASSAVLSMAHDRMGVEAVKLEFVRWGKLVGSSSTGFRYCGA